MKLIGRIVFICCWVFGALALLGTIATAQSQPPIGSGLPGAALPVGSFNLPLASPAQASRFLASRVVPASTMPPLAATQLSSGQAPVALNVSPPPGHELPTASVTQAGLPRAAFAIAKPGADADRLKRRQAVTGGMNAKP